MHRRRTFYFRSATSAPTPFTVNVRINPILRRTKWQTTFSFKTRAAPAPELFYFIRVIFLALLVFNFFTHTLINSTPNSECQGLFLFHLNSSSSSSVLRSFAICSFRFFSVFWLVFFLVLCEFYYSVGFCVWPNPPDLAWWTKGTWQIEMVMKSSNHPRMGFLAMFMTSIFIFRKKHIIRL